MRATAAAIVLLLAAPGAARAEPRNALFLEAAEGWVPWANDVPLMLGVGVRVAGEHETWARVGYMPTGDDVGWGFGCVGYRAVPRVHPLVRPVVGGLIAFIPATCGHDDAGRPTCERRPLFIGAAVGGVRVQPLSWLSLGAHVTLGVDSYPNPFGMVELVQTFAF